MRSAEDLGIRVEADEEGEYRVLGPTDTLVVNDYGATVGSLFRPRGFKPVPESSSARVVGASEEGSLLVRLLNRTIMAVDATEDAYFE